jgi:hypothetical protein
MIRDCPNGPEHPLCHGTTVQGAELGKDLFLDLWVEA